MLDRANAPSKFARRLRWRCQCSRAVRSREARNYSLLFCARIVGAWGENKNRRKRLGKRLLVALFGFVRLIVCRKHFLEWNAEVVRVLLD